MAGDNKVQRWQDPQPPANRSLADESKPASFIEHQLAGEGLDSDAVNDEISIAQVDGLLAHPEGIQQLLQGWREFKRQNAKVR